MRGQTPDDLEYHLLSLEFTGTNYVIGDQQDFPAAFSSQYTYRVRP